VIRGLIFDFDGLILDTETPSLLSWEEVYREHGCEFPFQQWAEVLGTSGGGFDCHQYLEEQAGCALDRDLLRARRRARTDELIALGTALPGVVEYLDEARTMGLRLGVASSSPRAWVEGHLRRLDLIAWFDVVVCAEDVPRVKPDPALYQRALVRLGLRPEEAIALEDSPNGITAARAAGIRCVAVPNPVTARLRIDHADHQLASMLEMPLASLLDEVIRNRYQADRRQPTQYLIPDT
jgi:HAD superfamily hydrolase (TIGR01509 family)